MFISIFILHFLFVLVFFFQSFYYFLFCSAFEFVNFKVLVLEENAIKYLPLFTVIFICVWRFYGVANGWVAHGNQLVKKQSNSSAFCLVVVPRPSTRHQRVSTYFCCSYVGCSFGHWWPLYLMIFQIMII